MKILLYSSKFPPQIGGVENVLKYLSVNFSIKHKVSVITTLNLSDIAPGLLSKFTKGFLVKRNVPNYQGVGVKSFFMSVPRSLFGYLALIYRFPASVVLQRIYIKQIKPDVVNAHFLDDSLYFFFFVTLGSKLPIYLDIHGNELHMFSTSPLYRFFMQKVINKSSGVIVHSEYMKKELLNLYRLSESKLSVLSNGIDLEHFHSNYYKSPPTLDYFLFVGRFDKKKGLDILLKAYSLIQNKITRKLIIVGSGRGEKKHGMLSLEKLSKKYKSKQIIFTGMISNKEVREYYHNAFYSVFPSLNEPFGIVALESMAFGTPFIASSGGFEEIIDKTGAGVKFKSGSVNHLSELMLKLDKNSKIRQELSNNCLKEINKYSWTSVSKEYLQILGKINL